MAPLTTGGGGGCGLQLGTVHGPHGATEPQSARSADDEFCLKVLYFVRLTEISSRGRGEPWSPILFASLGRCSSWRVLSRPLGREAKVLQEALKAPCGHRGHMSSMVGGSSSDLPPPAHFATSSFMIAVSKKVVHFELETRHNVRVHIDVCTLMALQWVFPQQRCRPICLLNQQNQAECGPASFPCPLSRVYKGLRGIFRHLTFHGGFVACRVCSSVQGPLSLIGQL